MTPKFYSTACGSLLAVLFVLTAANFSTLLAQDAVYRPRENGGRSKTSGKITKMSPASITIDTDAGAEEISAGDILEIQYADEPLELGRARDRIQDGQYNDALSELAKITVPSSDAIKAELDFLNAYASAKVALGSGDMTCEQAGVLMKNFIDNNPENIHLYEGIELLGRLSFAVNRLGFAEGEFEKMKQAQWPEMALKGHFLKGEALIESGKPAEAIAEYDAIINSSASDDITLQYKQLGTCRKAKAMALTGKSTEAIAIINEIIKVENPENEALFACAYNSLGDAYLAAENLKEARTAFLHTELLFPRETDYHAEALYNLAILWPKLQQSTRGTDARDTLKNRYRNSYWNRKLLQK